MRTYPRHLGKASLGIGAWLLSAAPAAAACAPGVLTKCQASSFTEYLKMIIQEDMGYIVLAALVMIIYSGIQYMISGVGSADMQKKAKERIVGILMGVALLLLTNLLLNQLGNNLTVF